MHSSVVHRLAVTAAPLLAVSTCVTPTAAQQPHETREIVFETSSGVSLAGSLTTPSGAGPHPAALIVSASGPHVRDEARTGGIHWSDLAARLADAGVASLRCDARGIAGSASDMISGWEYKWTPTELAEDSSAALAVLRNQAQIDPTRVGLIAFSDGALRAAMMASEPQQDIAFAAFLSASGVSAGENLKHQQLQQAAAAGKEGTELEHIGMLIDQVLDHLASEADRADIVAAIASLLEAMGLPEEQARAAADGAVDQLATRGARTYLTLDPSPLFEGVACPALTINGGRDNRIVSPESMRTLQAALNSPSRTDVSFMTFGGLDHFLEPPEPSDPPVFDDSVTRTIIEWLRSIGIADERS